MRGRDLEALVVFGAVEKEDSSIKYRGRSLVSLKILPMYSPRMPMKRRLRPPRSKIAAISEV